MKSLRHLRLWLLLVAATAGGGLSAGLPVFGAEPAKQNPSNTIPERPTVLVQLNDEQIRQIRQSTAADTATPAPVVSPKAENGLSGQLRQWLHALDNRGNKDHIGIDRVLAVYPRLPQELGKVLVASLGNGRTAPLFGNLFLIFLALFAGYGMERVAGHFSTKLGLQPQGRPAGDTAARDWDGPLGLIPRVFRLTAFGFTSLMVFLTLRVDDPQVKAAFMATFLAILLARAVSLPIFLVCRSGINLLWELPVTDKLADHMYRVGRFFAWYIACAIMFQGLIQELGAEKPVTIALGSLLGTVLILLIIFRMLGRRADITRTILNTDKVAVPSPARRQLAASWPFLALLYLFVVWVFWIFTVVSGNARNNGVLLASLLVVPIYLFFDRIGRWLVGSIIATLGLVGTAGDARKKNEPADKDHGGTREDRLRAIIIRGYRVFLALVLTAWMVYLWGGEFPLAAKIVKAAFDILITLTIALFAWRFASRFIAEKLGRLESSGEVKEIHDDEFGTTVQRGRSYTLLPMLRKFIATTLLVLVALIVLSTIGLDIAPLLAGAGVVGLAVGFGAQKLVSDVLSGLFYLLDDAFRVGEYIQAGSISGTVEGITLRNVMLRHHRGMLQIVPHSEMGSITNYMRGGIVVKFNLEFPYGTDVDQVRKIIKKVGQAMLDDGELGPGFLQPLKSQGVSEIANSVMIIRVKFTAHPGHQFLIRREAFRRISEALTAKGIHYAHRKVIVEVSPTNGNPPSPEQIEKAVEAGAAAGSLGPVIAGGEKPPGQEQAGMPGM